MKALFIWGDVEGTEPNSSRYRILIPGKYLEKAGHEIAYQANAVWNTEINGMRVPFDRIDWTQPMPDVVLIERNITPEIIEKLRLNGVKRIIATFDDHYGKTPAYSPGHAAWKYFYEPFKKALGMVDLAIVPSQRLLRAFQEYAPKIRYVPNYLDPDLWPEPDLDAPRNKVIAWGGSTNHVESWRDSGIVQCLRRVMERHADWELWTYGSAPVGLLHKAKVRFEAKPWVAFDDWPKEVSKFGLGLAPLAGPYDEYRSALKIIEYSRAGTFWIGSRGSVYDDYSHSGTLVKKADWSSAIEGFLARPNNHTQTRLKNLEWSRQYLASNCVPLYEEILFG